MDNEEREQLRAEVVGAFANAVHKLREAVLAGAIRPTGPHFEGKIRLHPQGRRIKIAVDWPLEVEEMREFRLYTAAEILGPD